MSVIWGIPYLLIKVADGGVSVPVLVCARVALGSLLLLPAAVRGGYLGALRGRAGWLAAFTATEIVGPFALLSNAERHLPSSTSGLLGAAAVIYAPFAALTWPRSVPSVQVLAALAALGVVCTAAAFMVFFRLIAEVGPARATVITYVNPAVAVALGVLVLGEHLTPAI